ncbi:hypothetical protein GCM10020331_047700 [Ectobacillus funiculus]
MTRVFISLYTNVVKGIHLTKGDQHARKDNENELFIRFFYQSLLTAKQRSYMSLYYLDDYSLGEIAQEFEVSRQAVYDNIKRTEAMLEEYEAKLLLFEKFQKKRQQLLAEMQGVLNKHEHVNEEVKHIVEAIENLE